MSLPCEKKKLVWTSPSLFVESMHVINQSGRHNEVSEFIYAACFDPSASSLGKNFMQKHKKASLYAPRKEWDIYVLRDFYMAFLAWKWPP
jgi:hypothetical protein